MATRLKVIVFTDRVGSSTAATDIGDASRARVNQTQELITRETAAETRGLVIKFLGDGHLLTFDSASDALRAGYRIQTRIAEYNAGTDEPLRFHLRIGIDVGDVDVGAPSRVAANTSPTCGATPGRTAK
jgi:class 3 adenylate cyclase